MKSIERFKDLKKLKVFGFKEKVLELKNKGLGIKIIERFRD